MEIQEILNILQKEIHTTIIATVDDKGNPDLEKAIQVMNLKAEGILNQEISSLYELESEGFKNGSYAGRKATVTASVLNVRYDRGTDQEVIGKLNKGDIVELGYCLNNWIGIYGHAGNKGLGYVDTDYLKLI